MPALLPLSPTYAAARTAFLAAAVAAGARVTAHVHPLRGPDGEELAIDVAELGPTDADRVIVVVSATHGVEGFCGSAVQRNWLVQYASERPPGVAMIMIHGLNPYGFAWVRRVNEDNVDLNRNFIDWSLPAPNNARYASFADLVVPATWTDDEQARTLNALLEVAGEMGLREFQEAVSGGQFHHRAGVFYGGTEPVWSHRWLRQWFATRLADVRRAAVIDVHTGLGPWGHGELIASEAASTPNHRRAAQWWGEVTSVADGDGVSAVIAGDWLAAAPSFAEHVELTAIAIEYGTVDPLLVLQALRADAWLHSYGDPAGAAAEDVRTQVRAAFADDDPAWLAAVWPRFVEVVRCAQQRLAT